MVFYAVLHLKCHSFVVVENFCRPIFLVNTREIPLFVRISADFQQGNLLQEENFCDVFHTLSKQGKFSCRITLFSVSLFLFETYPQTFPHPVENFFPMPYWFVVPSCMNRDKLRHFSDKSMTFINFHFVIPTKCCLKSKIFLIFFKNSRHFLAFFLFPQSFPQSVGKPVGNLFRQILKSP